MDRRVQKVVDFMKANLDQELELDEVARSVNLSPSRLRCVSRRVTIRPLPMRRRNGAENCGAARKAARRSSTTTAERDESLRVCAQPDSLPNKTKTAGTLNRK